jgi:two-component system, OmpR family, sensor histidine kinase MtrB
MTQPLADQPSSGSWFRRSAPLRLRGAGRRVGDAGLAKLAEWLMRFGAALIAVFTSALMLAKRLRRRWRSSLQLRVVSSTLMVSAVAVSLLGFFLMQQITADLLYQARQADYAQAASGLGHAQTQVPSSLVSGAAEEQVLQNILSDLKASGEIPNTDYGIALVPPRQVGNNSPVPWHAGVNRLPRNFLSLLPLSVVSQVNQEQVNQESALAPFPIVDFASLPYPTASSPRTTGLLYAAKFSRDYDKLADDYELYYFFPLSHLQQALSLILRTLVLVGLALVFLLAAIAWMVTRWVVVPVARAAQGAQRLSTGNLGERLSVRGNDEVAALATSFNEMAASLQEKMGQLEELSQVQRQFVSDVSHELRTPLTTIRMASDLLFEARDQLVPAMGRAAELLHGQLERFEGLLTDLLEISRYDANAATLDPDLADIGDLVRQSADVAQQLAERRGSKIEFSLPAEPCVAEVDRRRVERILRNLLVNAVEHGEGRDVVVTAAADRDAIAVVVRDFGVGLAPGEERLVFDRFWRADPARARTTGGSGLGLAIALEDARLHGGWLEAWGEPGHGSVFRLTLPREAGFALIGSPLPLAPGWVGLGGLMAEHADLTRADVLVPHGLDILLADVMLPDGPALGDEPG